MGAFRGLVPLLIVLLPGVALASQVGKAERLFERMQKAVEGQSYRGAIVYVGGQISAYRLVVLRGRYAELTSLDGPRIQIYRGRHVAVRLRLGGQKMVVRGVTGGSSPLPFPPATQVPLSQLTRFYRFVIDGAGRIANLPARIIELVPKDRWRYGYRVWIANSSHLPLRSELLNQANNVLEDAFFTQIKLLTNAAAHAQMGDKVLRVIHQAESSKPAGGVRCHQRLQEFHLLTRQLPPGFKVLRKTCQKAALASVPITHLIVGDGLSSVSVYISLRQPGRRSLVGATALGSVHAVGRVKGAFSVTAMGDVPFATVSRIVHSIAIVSK